MVRPEQNVEEEEADEDGNTLFTASYCQNRPIHVHHAEDAHTHTHIFIAVLLDICSISSHKI